METCAKCGKVITMHEGSVYVSDPFGKTEFGQTLHSSCYQDGQDVAAARRALADFEKRGGTTLEALKRELGL